MKAGGETADSRPGVENLELKAELRDPDLAEGLLVRAGALRVARVAQSDTHYRVGDGRLIRRRTQDEPVEWIRYHRPVSAPIRPSRFTIYTDEEARVRFGVRPLPVWMIVNKRRAMWVHDALRVHLDEVVGLGRFIEIEALVTAKRPADVCRSAIGALRDRLAPALGEVLAGGYADLAAREAA